MNFSLKKLIGVNKANAQVADGHLILSLPHALEPKVWRAALDKIGTTSFEIKQESDSDITKLILKPKKGTAEIIADFKNKKEAIDALMAASSALQKTSGYTNISEDNNDTPAKKTGQKGTQKVIYSDPPPSKGTEAQKWLIAVLGAIIVIGLYMYLTTLIPETNTQYQNQSSGIASSDPQSSTGVPVSADDFLGGGL